MAVERYHAITRVLALVAFEAVAVVGVHLVGRSPYVGVGLSDLEGWLTATPVDQVVISMVWSGAVVMAWWMLASTLVYAVIRIAELRTGTRFAVRFAPPAVRRVIDRSLAVTLVSTALLGAAAPALATGQAALSVAQQGSASEPEPESDPEPESESEPEPASSETPATPVPGQPQQAAPEPLRDAPSKDEEQTAPEDEKRDTSNESDEAEGQSEEDEGSDKADESGGSKRSKKSRKAEGSGESKKGEGSDERREGSDEQRASDTPARSRDADAQTAAEEQAEAANRAALEAELSGGQEGVDVHVTELPSEASAQETPGAEASVPEAPSVEVPALEAPSVEAPAPEVERPSDTERRNNGDVADSDPEGPAADSSDAAEDDEAADSESDSPADDGSDRPEGGGDADKGPRLTKKRKGAAPQAGLSYTVRAGDHLWNIATQVVSADGDGRVDRTKVASYWADLVQAARQQIHSGDPNIVYPGEQITLPPLADSAKERR